MGDSGGTSKEQIQIEIRDVEVKISGLEEQIRTVEDQIRGVEDEIGRCIADAEERKQLRDEKKQLRHKESQLRDEKAELWRYQSQLREQGRDGLPKKRRVDFVLQEFVKSAATHYTEWKQAEEESRLEVGVPAAGDEKKGRKGFLFVSEDPYEQFLGGNLIWVRDSYKHLQQILAKAGAGEKFTLLGTAGIGKSFFTVFWVCYLATLKGKVVWKFSSGTCYLLDFSEMVPVAYGPFSDENEEELSDVYNDTSAWLIVDGRQRCALERKCHILLACSANKENYKEFSKNPMVSVLYFPVWAEEEIIGFLDDFEDARADYPNMDVPSREIALGYFEKLGGVPRYVLCAKHTANRLDKLSREILYFKLLEKDTCLKYFTGTLHELEMKDGLIHINCWAGEYDTYFFDFASSHVQEEFGNRFNKLSRIAVVEFLEHMHGMTITDSYLSWLLMRLCSVVENSR